MSTTIKIALLALIAAMLLMLVAEPPALAQPAPGSAEVESGSAAPTKPSDAVVNPVQHPEQAWDNEKAARKVGWPLAIWLGMVMLGKALAYSRDKLKTTPLIGKLAAWLAKGKGAMILAAIVGVGAAGYNTMMGGGSWVAAIVAAGAAIGGVMHSTTKGADTPAPATPS